MLTAMTEEDLDDCIAGFRGILFKIAHHGSITGHHDRVWSEMLAKSPIAVLTPWTLGASQLPRRTDVDRINGLTAHAYSTSRLKAAGAQLPSAVRKTVEEAKIQIRHAEPPTGYVQLKTQLSGRGDCGRMTLSGLATSGRTPSLDS
jgi:hypothetical protein